MKPIILKIGIALINEDYPQGLIQDWHFDYSNGATESYSFEELVEIYEKQK